MNEALSQTHQCYLVAMHPVSEQGESIQIIRRQFYTIYHDLSFVSLYPLLPLRWYDKEEEMEELHWVEPPPVMVWNTFTRIEETYLFLSPSIDYFPNASKAESKHCVPFPVAKGIYMGNLDPSISLSSLHIPSPQLYLDNWRLHYLSIEYTMGHTLTHMRYRILSDRHLKLDAPLG